ncbi:MAG: PaaI family thioesterase [Syntrophomonadaceae bacterium]|nr:PaaI family thioesterase [Syntrophomonadaceae bacterium]
MLSVINDGIDQNLFDYLIQSVSSTPYYRLLGINLTLLGPGKAELEVQAEKQHTNPMGMVHGGLIMSIADAAMGNAIRSLGLIGVTVDCSVSFPGAARLGEKVTARGKVIKAGKNLLFAEATVWAQDRILGHSKSTFYNTGRIEL